MDDVEMATAEAALDASHTHTTLDDKKLDAKTSDTGVEVGSVDIDSLVPTAEERLVSYRHPLNLTTAPLLIDQLPTFTFDRLFEGFLVQFLGRPI